MPPKTAHQRVRAAMRGLKGAAFASPASIHKNPPATPNPNADASIIVPSPPFVV
jgi:hypothetical protein